jgi:DNA-binding NtrC family response regulator
MVVDDEIDILEKVRSSLENDDIEVIAVANSREALEMIDDKKEADIGLILIDTPMPGSNRSALFSMKPRSKMDTSNLQDFLQKPFTSEELRDFVKKRI